MLDNYAMPIITDVEGHDTAIFQQDGAPPHYATIVRDYLDETLPGRWCGRGGARDGGHGHHAQLTSPLWRFSSGVM